MQWAGEHFTKVDGEGAGGDEQGGVQGRGSSSPEARAAAEVTDTRRDWTDV